jgi:hypothetical protein
LSTGDWLALPDHGCGFLDRSGPGLRFSVESEVTTMWNGSRVTDQVSYESRRGELRGAVRILRQRPAERFRWRLAVAGVNKIAGALRGRDRMLIEEPIREIVLDLGDDALQREIVLDARKVGVDLDRGEVLPRFSLARLRELAAQNGVELGHLVRYTALPIDEAAPIDTAACVVVGRALAEQHKKRAHRLWLSVPDPDGPDALRLHHKIILERAELDRRTSERWGLLAQTLLGRIGA